MMVKNIFNQQKLEDHIKIANELLKNGNAYKCYCSS